MAETSPRVARLDRALRAGIPGALEQFWREVTAAGTPLIESVDGEFALVTFLWRGPAPSTTVAWGVTAQLSRLAGTDLWHGSVRLPIDLRTLYYLCHGAATGIPTEPDGVGGSHVDPHNHRRFRFPGDHADPTDRAYWASLLELPGAPAETWSVARPGVPRGRLLRATLPTAALGGQRRIWVYRPAGVPTVGLPTLVVFDGFLARTVLNIPTTLDNLIAAGRIPPLVALFVASPSGARRERELRPGPAVPRFVTRELLPWAVRRWMVSGRAADHVIAGSSLGGLAAAYVALRAPTRFGAVIAQSGSFWWPRPQAGAPEWLARDVANAPRRPIRFYMNVGTQETTSGVGPGLHQLAVNRRLRDALTSRGYPVSYAEYSGGHDYINWRRTFADGLVAVLRKGLGTRPQPQSNPQ